MAYELEVPVGRAVLWPAFTDPESMARAVPGLTVDAVQPVDPAGSPAGVSGDVVAGRLKLKVGAGTVTYRGTATIADADPAAGTLDIAIDVAQARGNGALAGYLRITLTPSGAGTLVAVVPDLELSGRVAEFRPEDLRESVGALAAAWVTALAEGVGAAPGTGTRPEVVAEIEAVAVEPEVPAVSVAVDHEPAAAEPRPEVVAAIEAVVAETDVEPDAETDVEPVAETAEIPETLSETPEASAAEPVLVSDTGSPAEPDAAVERATPAPLVDDSLSDDPLDVVWRGEYEKNPWIPIVALLTLLLILRRRRGKRRLMS